MLLRFGFTRFRIGGLGQRVVTLSLRSASAGSLSMKDTGVWRDPCYFKVSTPTVSNHTYMFAVRRVMPAVMNRAALVL